MTRTLHRPYTRQSRSHSLVLIGITLLLLSLVGCSGDLQQGDNAQQTSSSSTNFDYSKLQDSAVQQTALFGLQSSSVLYELGIDPTGVGQNVEEFRQKILNAPKSQDSQSNIPSDIPATDAEFFRNQRAIYSYTRSIPDSFREELKTLEQKILKELPQLRESDGFWLGEAAQLVSPTEVDKVTDDLIGSFIINGAFQNGYVGWVAQIVVNLDTWEVVDYHLVEPKALTESMLKVEATATIPSAQEKWPNASYIRRISTDSTISAQTFQGNYNPYKSPVALILNSGKIVVEK